VSEVPDAACPRKDGVDESQTWLDLLPGVLSAMSNWEEFVAARNQLIPGYPLTYPALGWATDGDLMAHLAQFGEADAHNAHRRYQLTQLLKLAQLASGDTAECGVYRGCSTALILRSHLRLHHAFDSFQGLSAPTILDGDYWTAGDLKASLEEVQRLVGEQDRVRYYPGWIPDRFEEVRNVKFAFVHIDVDLYLPTLASLQFFYPRLTRGAVLLCDDYGSTWCPGATQACDEYFADKVEPWVGLAASGGFMVAR